MNNVHSTTLAAAVVAGLVFSVGPEASADVITIRGIRVSSGAIDGRDLTGQMATVRIEFAGGLFADGEVFHLGTPTSASYEFSGAGLFIVDVPQSGIDFGSVSGWEMSFFNPGSFNMLSGTTAGDIGLDPVNGETLSSMFRRLGNGTDISFSQAVNFQMLNPPIGGLNGGASFVTEDLVGAIESQVTASYNVPAPGALALFGFAGFATRRRRRG